MDLETQIQIFGLIKIAKKQNKLTYLQSKVVF